MNEENDKNDNVNDPAIAFGIKRSIKLSSLKEQEEENYRYWLSLTPEQRVANSTALIKNVFADQLKSAKKNNRLFFDNL